MDGRRRKPRIFIATVSIAALLFGVFSIVYSIVPDLSRTLRLPEQAGLVAGLAAGVCGIVSVVSASLARQSYFWTLMGIIGMAAGVAVGLTHFQK